MAKLLSDEEVLTQGSQLDPAISEYNADRLKNIEDINYSMDFDRRQKGYKGESDIRYTTLMGELKKEQDLLEQSDEDKYFLKQQEYRYARAQPQASPAVGPANQTVSQVAAPAAQASPQTGKRRRLLTDEQVGASPRTSIGESIGRSAYDFVHGKADEASEGGGRDPRTLQHPEMEPRERIGIGMDMSKAAFVSPKPGGRLVGRGEGSDVGSLVVGADAIAGMGGQAFKSGVLYPNFYDHFLRTGMPPAEAAKEAQKISNEMVNDAFLTPFKKIVTTMGWMNEGQVDNSILGRAFGVLGQGMQEGAKAASEGTGGLIPPQHIEEAINAAMNVSGLAGGIAMMTRGRARPTARRAGPTEGRGSAEPQALPNPALEGEWMPGTRSVDQARESPFVRPEPEYGVEMPNPDIARLPRNVPRLTLKEAPAEAAQKFLDHHGGAIDPKLLKTMGVASALVAAGGWLYMNPEEAAKIGPASLLAAGAIKAVQGGFWHPQANTFLRDQVQYQLTGSRVNRVYDLQTEIDNHRRYGNGVYSEELIARHEAEIERIGKEIDVVGKWAESAAKKYLNKFGGMEHDPLKDIKIPPPRWAEDQTPMTWEQAMDQVITEHPVSAYTEDGGFDDPLVLHNARSMPRQDETVWDTAGGLRYSDSPAGNARMALQEYLSQVGEFARDHVPINKLPQYDFARLVKEAAAFFKKRDYDRMEPYRNDKKVSPVYREYPEFMNPDGTKDKYYWQQLDKPGQFARESDAMSHSVRGYEPEEGHPDWITESGRNDWGSNYGYGGWEAIKSGRAKVYSLRNKEGKSMVTIETGPQDPYAEVTFWGQASQEFKDAHPRPPLTDVGTFREGAYDQWLEGVRASPEYKEFLKTAPRRINQIKGEPVAGYGNKPIPERAAAYVLDFIREGNWASIGDIDYTPFMDFGGKIATKAEVSDLAAEALNRFMETPAGRVYSNRPTPIQGNPISLRNWDYWKEAIEAPRLGKPDEIQWSIREVVEALRDPHDYPHGTMQAIRIVEHVADWQARFDPKSPFKNELGKANPELLAWLAIGGTAAATLAYVAGDNKLKAATMALLGVGAFALFKPLKKGTDYVAGMASTRMGYESPVLKRRMRDFDRNVMTRGDVELDEAHPFLKQLSKVPNGHRLEIEAALRENDPVKIMQAFRGNRELETSWGAVQAQIHRLGGEYLPASLKENGVKGLKTTLTQDAAERLDAVLAKAEAKKMKDSLKPLSPMEVSMVVDRFLRAQDTSIFKPSFSRGHRGPAMDMMKDLGKYYVNATDNLLRYIGMSVYDKELANFFGGSRKTLRVAGREVTNIEDSILNLVNNGVKRGKIKADGAGEVIDLLRSRFGPGEESMNPFVQDVRNWTNTGLLGNFHASATQLSDSVMTVYHHGLFPVLEAVARRLGSKHYFTTKEFGLLNHIAEELGSQRFSSRFLHGTFRKTGFKAIDMFAKEIHLNASLVKNSNWAKTQRGRERLYEKYGEAFGDDFDALIDDLQHRRKTDRTKSLVFNELADAQVVGKSEMSQAMLDHPNGRLLAQMKQYMLKQIDVVRRDAFDEIRKGHVLRGTKNLLAVSAALSLSNVPGEAVKDWLSGREIDLNVDHVENFLQNFGLNRYTLDKLDKSKNPAAAAGEFGMQMIKPPALSVAEELASPPEGIVKILPGAGRAIYDRYMGGNERRAKAKEKSEKAKENKEKKRNAPPVSPLEQERREKRKKERQERYAEVGEDE